MHRFFLSTTIALNETNRLLIEKSQYPDLLHQLVNVLRIERGTELIFFDATRTEYHVQLIEFNKNQLDFLVIDQAVVDKELPFELCLAQAIPHTTEKWEWLLQKGTELGVTKFIPLLTHRTQRQHLPKMERMKKIMTEAVEQCGRTVIPTVAAPLKLADLAGLGTVVFASLQGTEALDQVLRDQSPISKLIICIGPEGGFSGEEEQTLITNQALPYSLGKRVLRLETAALASISIATLLEFPHSRI
ncbi:16S rRNA (uracil(1498)-N(3))-methyltransferase [Candidatus Gracilibacteria bacterium]|nr:16S rRNA (uracil(1498)-N(3))-methyltransferase [Candidatus Gracilibacteria bacterium]